MTKVIVSLAFIAVVTIITALNISDPINQQNRLARGRQNLYQDAQLFDASMSFFNLVAIVLIIGLIALIVVGVIALYRRLVDREAVGMHREYQAYKLEVSTRYMYTQPNFSGVHSVTYSPRDSHDQTHSITQHHKRPRELEYRQDVPTIDLSPLEQVQPVPSFSEAIRHSTKDTLVLGYGETGEPVLGSLDALYSCGNGGDTGTGKTSTAVYLAAQSVAHGASLIVIDPHAGHEQSLANKIAPLSGAYLCDVGTTEQEMLDAIHYTQSIFDARKTGARDCENYIIVMCDEWLSLMRGSLKNDFQRLAECITQEGRKYKMIAVFMSQTWNKITSGDMRDTLASHIVHRTRPALARQQTGLLSRELPTDIMRLKNGQFYLLDIFGDVQKLQAPRVTKEDLEQLANSIFPASQPLPQSFPTTSENSNPIGFLQPLEVVQEVQGSKTETQKPTLTARQAKIVEMLKNRMSPSKIAIELSGQKGGREYQAVMNEVFEVLEMLL